MQQAISLLELNQIIRDSLENNLSPSYWVIAEIGELKLAAAGHAYLELVEKNGNQVKAKIRANIWQYSFRTIAGRFQAITGKELRAGMKVLALATVTFHELYGISLTIKDIDPNYTLGERARIRQEIIDRLRQEGMMDLNKRFELPSVPQRVAVISSQTAAGYGDFVEQLQSNRYGYQVHFKLFPATLQGSEAAKTMIKALEQIEDDAQKTGYDMVIIIRGGGAQMDLDCFDDYDLSLAIAKFPIAILTGIGHERDETIADLVAHTKVKTPTAAAEFILSGFLSFEEGLLTSIKKIEKQVSQKILWEDRILSDFTSKLKNFSSQKISLEKQSFATKEKQIQNLALNKVKLEHFQLEKLSESLQKDLKSTIQKENQNLDSLEKAIKNLDPLSIFEKGYSRSEIDGKPIHSTKVNVGMEMVTISKNRKIKSTIQEISEYGK
ncbi:Exodeoxyribonuclease VII large subunit [Belliella baltica DSM 15883]|uniref:Exodeoxyribonuclease 7 large subunit n=1 Tax=Belliella baltica (strain DSM 15883 / CIP 108006 / LMG 21964 / BA134) TaxID=866536 RepID=I3Z8T3_BELBD|nr:exodeoxyribonuclease VII large subunit [Belliella baltica]AFL85651.1 Exodeoxyribonuclease VII large subunit [Belliella baltica DSM 15883]